MSYIKLTDDELEVIDKIHEITSTDYELEGNFFPTDSMIPAFEDLLCAYEILEEEFEDFKQNVEDNYEQIPVSRQYGWYEADRRI